MAIPQSRSLFTLALVALIALVILAVFAVCESDPEGTAVTGEVTDVRPRSITEFESLTITDAEGKSWTFAGGAFSGFTPSHLLEHQALGDPVKIWYVEEGGVLRVTHIEDG